MKNLDDENPAVIKAIAKITKALDGLPKDVALKLIKRAVAIDDRRRQEKKGHGG